VLGQTDAQLGGDLARDLLLDRQKVDMRHAVLLAPEPRAIGRLHELGGHDRRGAKPADASGDHGPHVELASELSWTDGPPLVSRHRAEGEHAQAGHLRQVLDDALGNAGRQVFELLIVRIVFERQHRDRADGVIRAACHLRPRQRVNVAGDDPPVELQRGIFGLGIELRPDRVAASSKLPQRIGPPPGERVQGHQLAVRLFVRRCSGHERLEAGDRPLVMMAVGRDAAAAHQQLFPEGAKRVTPLRAPFRVRIVGEQVARVQLQGSVEIAGGLRPQGVRRQPLELLDVDPQLTGRPQLNVLLRRDEELRIRPRAQLRLQRMTGEVDDLVQIRRPRLEVERGPEDGDQLLAVQLMARFEREQLDERFRLTSRPCGLARYAAADEDTEFTQELYRQRRCHRGEG
jgi:hypothetical protein